MTSVAADKKMRGPCAPCNPCAPLPFPPSSVPPFVDPLDLFRLFAVPSLTRTSTPPSPASQASGGGDCCMDSFCTREGAWRDEALRGMPPVPGLSLLPILETAVSRQQHMGLKMVAAACRQKDMVLRMVAPAGLQRDIGILTAIAEGSA